MICASLARSCRVLRDLHIISHSVLFVKGFFKSFSTFFKALSIRSPRLSAEVPDYYITSLFICQEVFQKFFNFFSWFLSGFFPFGKRPGYYITSLFVCQEVFQSFFNFFRDLFRGCSHLATACFASPAGASRLVPAYYSTSFPFCQPLFSTFFHFGIAGTLS